MRVRFRFLLLAATLFTASNSFAVPPEGRARHAGISPISQAEPLRVRLYDPYRLLSGEAEEWIRREVVRVFDQSGIGIRFVGRGGPEVIPATLYPELPDHWDVAPEAIGVAIGVPDERRSVFLSLGAAERALGFPRGQRTEWRGKGKKPKRGAGRQPRRLGIALGRVLAHELTHTIAPDCPHTRSGLMAERLSRRMLTAPGLRFDALATRHLREAAADLGAGAPETG